MYIGGSSPFYSSWTRIPFGRLYLTCGLVVVWFCARRACFLACCALGGTIPFVCAGGFLSCPLGGTYLLFDAHTFVRTAVCLPPVYCCFVVSWLFDVRARSLRARPCVSGAFQSKIPAASFHRIPHRTAHTLNDRARRVAAWTETIVARRVAAHGNGSTCCVATWALVVMHFWLIGVVMRSSVVPMGRTPVSGAHRDQNPGGADLC